MYKRLEIYKNDTLDFIVLKIMINSKYAELEVFKNRMELEFKVMDEFQNKGLPSPKALESLSDLTLKRDLVQAQIDSLMDSLKQIEERIGRSNSLL